MNQEATKTDFQVPAVVALTPLQVLDNAIARGATPEIIEKMMTLQERWEKNEARKAFDAAMANAKAEIPVIAKNRHVGFDSKKAGASRTDYKHEDLAEIARTIDPILAKHGLSYRFRTNSAPNEPVTVTCIVSHSLGHSEENTLQGPRDDTGNKNGIQQIGSTLTYLQRYTLKAALGLAASADDDGNAAGGVKPITEEQLVELDSAIVDIAAAGGFEEKPTRKNFCKVLGIDSLADLPATRFEEAKDLLAQRRKAAK